ncbi:hypothetical protein FB451DRAFT_1190453 [Mycena latifolia]|nr:hypothetical protein FB451DRAFT_1190453 [Mycena latifolia]
MAAATEMARITRAITPIKSPATARQVDVHGPNNRRKIGNKIYCVLGAVPSVFHHPVAPFSSQLEEVSCVCWVEATRVDGGGPGAIAAHGGGCAGFSRGGRAPYKSKGGIVGCKWRARWGRR